MKQLNYCITILLCTGMSGPVFSQDDIGVNTAFLNMLNVPPDFIDSLTMLHYTQITKNQASTSPMTFGVLVENYGTNTANNATLYATVSGAGTYSDSSAAVTINAGDSAYMQVASSTFTPTATGTYNINLKVGMTATDQNPGNDSITPGVEGLSTFDVSDTVWARDINQQLGSFYFGPSFIYKVGNLFTVTVQDTATTISCHFAPNNTANKTVMLHIWDDPYATNPTSLAQSDWYTITANDIGEWVTLPFATGTILDNNNLAVLPPGRYLVGVETFDDPTYISKGQISGVTQGIVLSDPNHYDQWFYTTSGIPKIRLNMGSRYIQIGMDENKPETVVSVFPNPTTGVFTVQGTTEVIQVHDLYGRVVLKTEQAEIDLSSYPAGIYFVKTGEAVRKLVLR